MLPREPDHEFDTYLRVAGRSEQLCDCLIWLPKDASEDAKVEITVPMSPEPPINFGPGPLTFMGRDGRQEITLSGVWLKSGPAHRSPPRVAGRSRVELFQIDHIIERTGFRQDSDSANRFPEELNFALTDCTYLRPAISTEWGRFGGEKVTVVGQFTVQYCPLGRIKFERRYTRYRREDVPGTVTTFELVASITDPTSSMIETMEVTQENMEDACLLASLAARHRVMVVRIDSVDQDTFCQKWIDPLRRPRPEPQNDRFAEGLIPPLEFEHFFRMAGNEFYWVCRADRKRIRDVIYILAPVFDLGSVEPAFLSAFSALEGLSRFGKGDAFGGLTIVDETRWKLVKRAISDALGDLRETLSQDERASIRQKIGELNRPALKASINQLLAQHSVEVDDLWPIFGSTAMPGLAEIRNRLAHGEAPTGDAIAALSIARSHLWIILERCLLSVFRFPVSKSRASRSCVQLQTVVEHDRIEEFRRMLAPKIPT